MPNTNNQLVARIGRAMSHLFGSPRSRVIVVGCDARVRLLVTELGAAGKEVSLIKPATAPTVQNKAPLGVNVFHSSRVGVVALERAGAKTASCLLAATRDDELNASLCREARERFGVPVVIARTNDLEGAANWVKLNKAGTVSLSWADTVQAVLGQTAPNEHLWRLASIPDQKQIVDLEMRSPVFLGRKVADLPLDDCEVLALTRGGILAPDIGSIKLRMNDVLTLVGTKVALTSVRESVATL